MPFLIFNIFFKKILIYAFSFAFTSWGFSKWQWALVILKPKSVDLLSVTAQIGTHRVVFKIQRKRVRGRRGRECCLCNFHLPNLLQFLLRIYVFETRMSKSWLNLSRILFYLFFLQFSPKILAIRWSFSPSFWIAPMCRKLDSFSGHFWLLRKRRMYKWKMKRPNHLFTAFWEFASRLQSIKFCNFSHSLFIWLLWTAHFLYGMVSLVIYLIQMKRFELLFSVGRKGKDDEFID